MQILTSRRRSRSSRLREAAYRWAVELLEERTLLNAFVVSNTNNSGASSLRQAILDANSRPGLDTISFDIPGLGVHTIKPTFLLPLITDPVEIHGETQPGYSGRPLIELDGSLAGACNGLEIKVGGNLIQGLNIHSFRYDGIVFAEDTNTPTGGNRVINNFLGTDSTGTLAKPNLNGIHLVHSPHNIVKGNLLSGNADSGIFVADAFSADTRILGNLIGTDITGMLPLGNTLNGVALGAPASPTAGDGFASGNVVGSTVPGERNVISGNGGSGVWIKGGSNNVVLGNYIGVAVDGVTPLANGTAGAGADPRFGTDGILIDGAAGTVIGGIDDHAGNVISANGRHGIEIINGASGNKIQGNYIGTDAGGTAALPNAHDGVAIFGSPGNLVGGGTAGARNVISGNTRNGVHLGSGAGGDGSDDNQVFGNYIGVDATGAAALANKHYGIEINGGRDNLVGAPAPGSRNVISGNGRSGVVIGGSGTTGTRVSGNFIGTDASGLLARPNGLDGIDIYDSGLNVIGGSTPASRNVISGNAADGIYLADRNADGNVIAGNYIGTDLTGMAALGNGRNGVFIGGLSGGAARNTVVGGPSPGARNVISGNGNDGVQISGGPSGNTVRGNFIGTLATGLGALPNARHGVAVFDSSDNTIGATGASSPAPAGNVISGNDGSGVVISGAATATATRNRVLGNFIGTDITGARALGNARDGILVESAAGNVIGGADATFRNVISGNGVAGVVLTGNGTQNTTLTSNYIGTDASGSAAVPNLAAGIFVNDVPDNRIGSDTNQRNVISGNDGFGVYVTGPRATGNRILGNFIGTDGSGTLPLGNQSDGVRIDGAPDNRIGGIEVGENNVIAANESNGVSLTGAGATGNKLEHNVIGTDLGKSARLGNQRYGVEVLNGAKFNTVGGAGDTYGNTVAFNGAALAAKGHGVVVPAGGHNAIRANSIFQNSGRGIDIVNAVSPDTFTVNDPQTRSSPNDVVQDSPVVTAVYSSGGNMVINWTLNSTPNTAFTIEAFANASPHPSGFGDGTTLLTTHTVTTDARGNAFFHLNTPSSTKYVAVTATGPSDDTSEFSMVDTDADGLADAWETRGIDFDEDGTVDLTLPGANPEHRDLYVEVDAMASVVPDPAALQTVVNAFSTAPVANPDGAPGIMLHAALDEVIPDQSWLGDFNGNGRDALGEDLNTNQAIDPGEDVNGNGRLDPGDPADQDPFAWFDVIKRGGNPSGGFGDSDVQRGNAAAMGAKRLAYRYALFALSFADNVPVDTSNPVGGTTLNVSGIAEIGGNDFIVTLDTWAFTVEQQAGTFMHELGHTLGLRHGGADDLNDKPNYNSVMNYLWQTPQAWMKEDQDGDGVQDFADLNNNGVRDGAEPFTDLDYNGDGDINDAEWAATYSTAAIDTLDENNLVESVGIKGVAGRWQPGPGGYVLQTGPVDWSQGDADGDGNKANDTVTTGLDINGDGSVGDKLKGFEDWSHVQYYFLDNPDAADGVTRVPDPGVHELTLDQWAAMNARGNGPGLLQFLRPVTTVSEGVGSVTITVIRGGGTHGAVSVDYSTGDGTARSGFDYLPASGTLSFADGEYLKRFTVPVRQDSDAERTEQFHVTLRNATGGAMLLPNGSATVDIVDDDLAGHFIVTNANDSGPGSLRQAIINSNNRSGRDLIEFRIGTGLKTITPLSALPAIRGGVEIDGTTQPGFAGKPIIEISGQSAPGSGFTINASDTTVRGLVINRFSDFGIVVYRDDQFVERVVVEGCYVGTDVSGLLARGNGGGILLSMSGGFGFRIGGTTPEARNVIAGNASSGVVLGRTQGADVKGNYIGVGADGVTPLGNRGEGVAIVDNAYGVTVGGLEPGAGNVIAYNQRNGVVNAVAGLHQFFFDRHAILSNSIHDNGLRGIDLGGRLNDVGLTDGSFGNVQNYPVLGSAMSSGGKTTLSGYLNSRPGEMFTLQFFANSKIEASGFGEGETLIGTATVQTGADGHADFTFTFDAALADRTLVVATATDSRNETSEFSRRLAVGDVLGNVYVVNTTDDTDDGVADAAHTSLREAIHAVNNHPGPDVIRFAIGTGVKTLAPLTPLPVVNDAVTIDGTTQPGFAGTPVIELVGTQMERNRYNSAAASYRYYLTGLVIEANDSVVRGLAINRFYNFTEQTSNADLWGGQPLLVTGDRNVVEGNFIGTDVTGTVALRNLQGVRVGGTGNRVGGTTAQARNLISGNFEYGLIVNGVDTVVQGNFIGTDVTGTKALANGRGTAHGSFAIHVGGSRNTLVGGTAPEAGNVISGNLGDGISVGNSEGTLIQGNLVGTDLTGTRMLGNQGTGVHVQFNGFRTPGQGVTIGGTTPGARNVISNNFDGILLETTIGDVIQGNYIGTDITGTRDFGNSNRGIIGVVLNGLIGGTVPGAGNVISGNGGEGIRLVGSNDNAARATIQGNFIGTQADGVSPLGNGSDGIALLPGFGGDADDTLIGGTEPGAGNVIAYNGGRGVLVVAGTGEAVLSNLIYANTRLGIDLKNDGVTPNDAGDADAGPNKLQNYPVLTGAATDGTRTAVAGTLNSTPNSAFLLQFFSTPAADPSGFGQGKVLLGSHFVFTDASGNASFDFSFPVAVPTGQVFTATATDALNNTSEFSNAVTVPGGTVPDNRPPAAHSGGPYTINEGSPLKLDGSRSDDPDTDSLTYSWDINGDGAFGDATGAQPTLTWARLKELGVANGPGSFPLRVRVDDGQGHAVTSSPVTLTVSNVTPAVKAGEDLSVAEGEAIHLTGKFTDPGDADTHTLRWHVTAQNGQVIADGTGGSFDFTPLDNGDYVVTFTVTDGDGAAGTDAVLVRVYNAPPVGVVQGVPAQGRVGVPVTLTSTVTDVSPIDTAAGFTYGWLVYSRDAAFEQRGRDADFTFTPTNPGTYDVYFFATDKDRSQYAFFAQFVVASAANAAPAVSLPPTAAAGEGSAFTSAGTFADPDVGDNWTATVDYGDGTGVHPLALNADKTFSLSHVYAGDGLYEATVTVTDGEGLSDAKKMSVVVKNVAPLITLGQPLPVAAGGTLTLTGSFDDPGADAWTATVDYGDGTGTRPLALNPDKSFTLSHTYLASGSFDIVVSVSDDDDGSDSVTRSVAAEKRQASLSAAPASGVYGGTTTLSATLTSGGSGVAGKTLTFSLNGSAVGSATTDAAGVARLSDVAIGLLAAGTASVTVAFAGDAQNAALTASATLAVDRASLVVNVDGKSRTYGQDNPPFTGSIVGLRNGDDITAAFTTNATKTAPVGTYAIGATLNNPSDRLRNYDVTVNDGILTILAATLVPVGMSVGGPEGSSVSGVVATFTSDNPIASAADFVASITWGDGHTTTGVVSSGPAGGFDVSGTHTYADDGTFAVTVSVQDNAGQGAASAVAQAAIFNVAPTPALDRAPATGTIGTPISVTASATDPSSADTATGFTFAWAVTRTANGVTSDYTDGTGAAFAFTPADAGVYTVTLTATDKDGGSSSTSRTVEVAAGINVAPAVSITGPSAGSVFSVGDPVTFTGTFTDPDSPGPRTAVWTLNAPGLATITIAGVISGNRVTASYAFQFAGVYSLSLAVTDSQGATGGANSVGSAPAQVVLYDANAGRITGGGFVGSQAGSLASDPGWSGKARLGFVAQYKKGEKVPTGELQFTAGGFNFHTNSFDWLVVNGIKAQLKGTGIANGRRYAFLLTIIDGRVAGRADRLRLKIWDAVTGAIAFDNQPGAAEDATPPELRGGNATVLK